MEEFNKKKIPLKEVCASEIKNDYLLCAYYCHMYLKRLRPGMKSYGQLDNLIMEIEY